MLGSRAQVSSKAQMVGVLESASPTFDKCVLDATSYGGYYWLAGSAGTFQVAPYGFVTAPATPVSTLLGTYHLFHRFLSQQTTLNIKNVQVQMQYVGYFANNIVAFLTTALLTPLSTGSRWTAVDAGQQSWPPAGSPALQDPATLSIFSDIQWTDSTGGGSLSQAGWFAYVPIDGSLVIGSLANSAYSFSTGRTLWQYYDRLGTQRGQSVGAPTFNLGVPLGGAPSSALPSPASGMGLGTNAGGTVLSLNSSADPYLVLDPTLLVGSTAVNQLVGWIADSVAAQGAMPLLTELQYAPLYLTLR